MKKVVFPGSFDPITLGHYDIICRATELFDEIIVAVGENADKRYMFSVEQRMDFIAKCFADYKQVKVVSYQGLTVVKDYRFPLSFEGFATQPISSSNVRLLIPIETWPEWKRFSYLQP